MKYLEYASEYHPIDETVASVEVMYRHDGRWVAACTFAGQSRAHEVVFDSDDLVEPLPFLEGYERSDIGRTAAFIVQARLIASLAADHLKTIHDDHVEFVTCLLIEQQEVLSSNPILSPTYIQNWQQAAAARVTGGMILIDAPGCYHCVVRTAEDAPYVEATGGGRYAVFLRSGDRTTPGGRIAYAGTLAECRAAVQKILSSPWQETLTTVELRRWVERHTVKLPATATTPTRQINIPTVPELAGNP